MIWMALAVQLYRILFKTIWHNCHGNCPTALSDSLVYIHSLLHELTVKRVRCRLGDTIKMLHPNVNCCSFLQFWYELNVVFLFVQRSHERLSPPLIATKYFHVLKIHRGNDCGNRLMIFYYYINNRILLPWRVSRHVFYRKCNKSSYTMISSKSSLTYTDADCLFYVCLEMFGVQFKCTTKRKGVYGCW